MSFRFDLGFKRKTSRRNSKSPRRRNSKLCSIPLTKKWKSQSAAFEEKPGFTLAADGVPEEPLRLSSTVSVPVPVNKHLRDYQRQGVEFLFRRFVDNAGGVLADDMGLGKTVQTIAFLSAIYKKSGTERDKRRLRPEIVKVLEKEDRAYEMLSPSFSGLDTGETEEEMSADPSLIILPLTVMKNWESEFETWGYFSVEYDKIVFFCFYYIRSNLDKCTLIVPHIQVSHEVGQSM